MNRVTIAGRLGADPELRHSSSGTAVLKLRIATNERVKKGDEWVDHTEWHSVVSFGRRAEALANHLTKGSPLVIGGRLRTSSYEKNGERRYRTEIVADDVELLGTKRDAAEPRERDGSPSDSQTDFDGDGIPF